MIGNNLDTVYRYPERIILFKLVMVLWICVGMGTQLLRAEPSNKDSLNDQEEINVSEQSFTGSFPLADSEQAIPIVIDENDAEVVSIASASFANDIERVAGKKPQVYSELPFNSGKVVIAGSIKKSGIIKKILQENEIDATHIQGNAWESFIITVVEEPVEGVDRALIVAGSDARGTAFGLFELSEIIGVSPWAWWADGTVKKKKEIHVSDGLYEFGPPSVKYRGIFLNDERWGLRSWASKTLDPEYGNIGPETYERIFELLLRLKANQIWPAMHEGTTSFYQNSNNQETADDYSIIVSSSHTEVMLFNNASEWNSDTEGPWDYTQNSEEIKNVWRERVNETAQSENIYQTGIRGVHDTGMEGANTHEEGAGILEEVISDQREILSRTIGKEIADIPQVFTPYKEVLDYYNAGLSLPEDITLMWVDDNFSNIRRFSDEQEQKRNGGGGVYYHLSYLGTPHPYLWLETVSPYRTWREMKRAWVHNMRDNWIVNVGDLKRREWGMEFFLQMGWDIDKWNSDNIRSYFKNVAARDISEKHSEKISDLMWEYYQLAAQRKPELMGFSFHWFGLKEVEDPGFSLWNYGDRVQSRIDRYRDLRESAEELYSKMGPEQKAPFFQLVYYPVRGAANINEKLLHAYKSRAYADQGRIQANYHADRAEAAFDRILEDTRAYNKEIADGKWKHIVDYSPGFQKVDFIRGANVFAAPDVERVYDPREKGIDVAIEGSEIPLSELENPDSKVGGKGDKTNVLPQFNRYTKEDYFIDIYNKGETEIEWTAKPGEPWINLSAESGVLHNGNERISVSIDYDKLPEERSPEGYIQISGVRQKYRIYATVFNKKLDISKNAFIEDNKVISVNAENYQRKQAGKTADWIRIDGMGRSGSAMVSKPISGWYIDEKDKIKEEAPVLEYQIYVTNGGDAELRLEAVPSFPLYKDKPLRAAVSINNEKPEWITFKMGEAESDTWFSSVANNAIFGSIGMNLEPGSYKLKVWATDPSININKLVFDFGDQEDSYLGPEETNIVDK